MNNSFYWRETSREKASNMLTGVIGILLGYISWSYFLEMNETEYIENYREYKYFCNE